MILLSTVGPITLRMQDAKKLRHKWTRAEFLLTGKNFIKFRQIVNGRWVMDILFLIYRISVQTVSAKWNAPYVLRPALLAPILQQISCGPYFTFGWYNPFTYIWRIFMVNVRKYTIPWILWVTMWLKCDSKFTATKNAAIFNGRFKSHGRFSNEPIQPN